MRGALLRSGKIEDLDALGEAGTPVHRMALQLREAVRRKGPDLAEHLAIPQINQAGDNIDWYAPKSGPVIPWSASTEEERIPARAQMEALKAGLNAISTRLLDANADTPDSDTALFAKLLNRAPYFPDESYVYLVDGTPVVTFWGFDHVGSDRRRNPLLCLYSPPPTPVTPQQPSTPLPPATPAVLAEPVVAATRPWWKRWWWLILLPLLLLLLLGLRGCTPGSPGWPSWMPFGVSAPDLTPPQLPALDAPSLGSGPAVAGHRSLPGDGLIGGNTGIGLPASTSDVAPDAGLTDAATDPTLPDTDPAIAPTQPDPDAEPADAPADTDTQMPPALDPAEESATEPASASPSLLDPNVDPAVGQANALTVPPNLPNGPADFLNGHWRAGAGIQDAQTGKPLRLEYQFQDGQGQVTVTRGQATCQGPVGAAMQGGALQITPQGQASCSDGGQYELPQIQCTPGATTSADCAGNYGDMRFPLSMRQAVN